MFSYWLLLLLLLCGYNDHNFSCSFSLSIQSLHIQMLLTYRPLFTWPCSSTSGSTKSVTGEPHLAHSGTNFTKYPYLYVYIILLICIYIHYTCQSLTLISKNCIWLLWSLWLITCIIINTYKDNGSYHRG
jgi:hypothetical protein